MSWLRPSRPSALLGLVFEDEAVLATLARTEADELPAPLRLPCALDRDDPVLLGRALRRALRAAGWKWDRCVVGLPTEWCLALATTVPDLSPEDLDAFLALEAERGLPSDLADWVIGRCTSAEPSGKQVLQVALSRPRLARIETMLRAAGLRPTLITATLAAAALAGTRPAIVVRQGRSSGALCLAAPSGVVTLRSVGTTDDSLAELARELRITREAQPALPPQAPARLLVITSRPEVVSASDGRDPVTAFGRAASVEVHADDVLPGLLLTAVRNDSSSLPSLRPATPARWSALLQRPGSRRLRTLALAAAAGLVVVAAAFAWREIQLQALRHDWSALRPEVQRLSDVQTRLREFRAWDDPSLPSLALLRLVSEAFPESGTVTARSVELRPPSSITVSGSAREHGALLATVDRLRQQPSVRNVRVEQIRGQSPAQFTFAVELNRPASP
jgi:hypothetical protein